MVATHRAIRGWSTAPLEGWAHARTVAAGPSRHHRTFSAPVGRHRAPQSRTRRSRPSVAAVFGGIVVAGLMTLMVPAAQAEGNDADSVGLSPQVAASSSDVAGSHTGGAGDLRVEAQGAEPGAVVRLAASGFLPGTTVRFAADPGAVELGWAAAGPRGVALLQVKLAEAQTGELHISAAGSGLFGDSRVVGSPFAAAAVARPTAAGFALSRPLGFAGIAALFGLWLLAAGPGRARLRSIRGGAHL